MKKVILECLVHDVEAEDFVSMVLSDGGTVLSYKEIKIEN